MYINIVLTVQVNVSTVLAAIPTGYRPRVNTIAVYTKYISNGNEIIYTGPYQLEIGTNGNIKQTISSAPPVGSKFEGLFIYAI